MLANETDKPVSAKWLRELAQSQPYLTLQDISVMAGVPRSEVKAALSGIDIQLPPPPGTLRVYKMTHIPD